MYCTKCGSEITAPKWNEGKPYGWKCYSILFGESTTKGITYLPVKLVTIIRRWDDVIHAVAEDSRYIFTGKTVIIFTLPEIKASARLTFRSDLAYEENGQWYAPGPDVKSLLKIAKKKSALLS